MSENPYDAPSSSELGPSSFDGRLASLGDRAIAKVVDLMLLALAFTVGLVPILIDLVVLGNEEEPGPLGLVGSALILLLFLTLHIVQWVLISHSGQSIGKRIKNIQIRKKNGQLPGFIHGVILRGG